MDLLPLPPGAPPTTCIPIIVRLCLSMNHEHWFTLVRASHRDVSIPFLRLTPPLAALAVMAPLAERNSITMGSLRAVTP